MMNIKQNDDNNNEEIKPLTASWYHNDIINLCDMSETQHKSLIDAINNASKKIEDILNK